MVQTIDDNDLCQMFALRRKWLPHETDDEKSLARAIWIEKKHWENMAVAMANGTAKAFAGK